MDTLKVEYQSENLCESICDSNGELMSFKTPLIIYSRTENAFYLKFVDEEEIVTESDHLDFENDEIYEMIFEQPQKVLAVLNEMQKEKKISDSMVGGYNSLGEVCFFLGEEAYEEDLMNRLNRQ